MPCNSDYLAARPSEVEASKVLALLDELETGILPEYFGDGYYSKVYDGNEEEILSIKVPELCKKLQNVDVSKYSLEMQSWWRDHQKADKERIEKVLELKREESERQKAINKLSKYERGLLGLNAPQRTYNKNKGVKMKVYIISCYDENENFLRYLSDNSGKVFEFFTPEAAWQTLENFIDSYLSTYNGSGGSLRVTSISIPKSYNQTGT